jgi:hypothetical protein
MTSYSDDENFDREVERFSPLFSDNSSFDIHPSIFEETSRIGHDASLLL